MGVLVRLDVERLDLATAFEFRIAHGASVPVEEMRRTLRDLRDLNKLNGN